MLNKVMKNMQKQKEALESAKLYNQILEKLKAQGGKYTQEQEIALLESKEDFDKKLEALKVESLKKNLALF